MDEMMYYILERKGDCIEDAPWNQNAYATSYYETQRLIDIDISRSGRVGRIADFVDKINSKSINLVETRLLSC